jgi:hypothetical protein
MSKSVISTKDISKILNQFNYEHNPVMFQIFGEHVWFPTKEPMDLMLASKSITMSELVPIRTENQLVKLIKSKLAK